MMHRRSINKIIELILKTIIHTMSWALKARLLLIEVDLTIYKVENMAFQV